jgi:hypothetical protein
MSPRVICAAAQAWISRHYPGMVVEGICIKLNGDKKVSLPAPPPRQKRNPTPFLITRSHQRILDAATSQPTPGKNLIRKSGLRVNSSSRQLLTDLVRATKLIRSAEGYRLPG